MDLKISTLLRRPFLTADAVSLTASRSTQKKTTGKITATDERSFSHSLVRGESAEVKCGVGACRSLFRPLSGQLSHGQIDHLTDTQPSRIETRICFHDSVPSPCVTIYICAAMVCLPLSADREILAGEVDGFKRGRLSNRLSSRSLQ